MQFTGTSARFADRTDGVTLRKLMIPHKHLSNLTPTIRGDKNSLVPSVQCRGSACRSHSPPTCDRWCHLVERTRKRNRSGCDLPMAQARDSDARAMPSWPQPRETKRNEMKNQEQSVLSLAGTQTCIMVQGTTCAATEDGPVHRGSRRQTPFLKKSWAEAPLRARGRTRFAFHPAPGNPEKTSFFRILPCNVLLDLFPLTDGVASIAGTTILSMTKNLSKESDG
jgi:hypothetical protein